MVTERSDGFSDSLLLGGGELRAALERVDGDVDSRLVDQLFVLSRLVDHKFRLTRGALLTLLAGTVLTIAAIVIDAIVN